MTSYRVWIPSQQKYSRFNEINCEQYRNLLKSIDENDDFDYSVNELLHNNLIDKSLDLSKITIIDRFIIILQLKIYSCNHLLKLTRVCEKCETQTAFAINLNSVIESLASTVDKSFYTVIDFPTMDISCDIPSINSPFCLTYDIKDVNQKLNYYLYSFIKDIRIQNEWMLLDNFSIEDRISICEQIPFMYINYIRTIYIEAIHKNLKDSLIVTSKCSNTTCDDELTMNFDINNISDMTKILFKDSSAISVLQQYASISSNCHFDYNFYRNICPAELDIIYDLIKSNNKPEEETPQTNKEIDLFQEYRLQTEGMVETPSEF